MTYKEETIARIAKNTFGIYDDLNSPKKYTLQTSGRVLRSALYSAYEAGQDAPTDTYAEALKIAMAPSKIPPKSR